MEGSKKVFVWEGHSEFLKSSNCAALDPKTMDFELDVEEKTVKCHKIILRNASAFVETILSDDRDKSETSSFALISAKYKTVVAIIEWIYHGKVEIEDSMMEDFEWLARVLKLKGWVPSNPQPSTPCIEQEPLHQVENKKISINPSQSSAKRPLGDRNFYENIKKQFPLDISKARPGMLGSKTVKQLHRPLDRPYIYCVNCNKEYKIQGWLDKHMKQCKLTPRKN